MFPRHVFQTVIHVTKKKQKFSLTWIRPLEKTQNSLPQLRNPFSFWKGLGPKGEELDAMWIHDLEVLTLPLPQAASTGQSPYKVGNQLSQTPPF